MFVDWCRVIIRNVKLRYWWLMHNLVWVEIVIAGDKGNVRKGLESKPLKRSNKFVFSLVNHKDLQG